MNPSIPAGDLLALAEKFGTPLYIYHADTISSQYEKLKKAFSGFNSRIFYACKALTNISILKHMAALGLNIDCSSINEVKIALKAGFSADRILYTSSNIAFKEIKEAKELGVSINIDSFSNLEKFAKAFKGSYPVGIRLRPGIMAGGNLKISTGHDKSKFGIPLSQLNEIYRLIKEDNLLVHGLHIHTGSDVKEASVFMKVADVLYSLVPNFPDLKYLDFGGGFKVPYHENDESLDVQILGNTLQERFAAYAKESGNDFQYWFEPGKFLVSESGYFLVNVNVLKPTDSICFAGVDSGFNHLIRPMFYDAYHSIINISNPNGKKKLYTVTGNICETDTFASDREIAEIRENDKLLFFNAGAYGIEMASNYNSRLRPAEVMVKDGRIYLIRKREMIEDLLKNQVYEEHML